MQDIRIGAIVKGKGATRNERFLIHCRASSQVDEHGVRLHRADGGGADQLGGGGGGREGSHHIVAPPHQLLDLIRMEHLPEMEVVDISASGGGLAHGIEDRSMKVSL